MVFIAKNCQSPPANPLCTGTKVGQGNTALDAALSLVDFNVFRARGNVIQAIDILDQKIRDILAVTEPTCQA